MESVMCPLCSTNFPSSVIENHASTCNGTSEISSTGIQSSQLTQAPIFTKRQHCDISPKPGKRTSTNANKKHKIENSVAAKKFLTPSPIVERRTSNELALANSTSKQENISSSVKSAKKSTNHMPLAELMRPTTLIDYVGQPNVISDQSIVLPVLKKGEMINMILWGPPGCGKTSLMNIIMSMCKEQLSTKYRCIKLSATTSGVPAVKEVINTAISDLKLIGRQTVMIMDEIHRFNKLQQDIFLSHVEDGSIILVGATTENPSFSINSALLSRVRVIVLNKLSIDNIMSILTRAVQSIKGVIYKNSPEVESLPEIPKFLIDEKTIQFLADTSDGDARIALGGLELAVQSMAPGENDRPGNITLENIKEGLKKSHTLYDKNGDQHYDMISALHKSVRASDVNASVYWLVRMIEGGENPVYIARRLVRMASEDIGLEDPNALNVAVNTMLACNMIGMPESDVILTQCVVYLARAPKSRSMEDALRAAQRAVKNHKGPQPGVPLHLRNAPTKLMRDLGYGKNYNTMNCNESGLTYLPEGLEDLDFFKDEDSVNTD